MKNFKRILAVLLAATLIFAFAACTKQNTNQTTNNDSEITVPTTESTYKGEPIKVAAISGPTGMGMVNLFDNANYKMELVTDPTTIPAMLTSGSADIVACPLNMASALYNKTNGAIRILGLNTLGVLYIVSKDDSVKKLSDLEGKKIYASGQGTVAEYLCAYTLEKNGLKDKVEIEYLSEHSEVSAKYISGEADICVLPEPFVSIATNGSEAKSIISLTEEWTKLNPDTELTMGCVITTAKYAKENPDAIKQFIADNKASVEYVNLNPTFALDKIIGAKILPEGAKSTGISDKKNTEAIKNTITRCNIVFIDGEQMQTIADANFAVYAESAPQAIGGKAPAADIYYIAK